MGKGVGGGKHERGWVHAYRAVPGAGSRSMDYCQPLRFPDLCQGVGIVGSSM